MAKTPEKLPRGITITYRNRRGVPTKRPKGTVMKLSNGPGVDGNDRFVSGQWQAGNVAKVLNNQTTVAWLATQSNQAAA